MRRAAVWLFPLIAFSVAVFIAIFLVDINSSVPNLHTVEEEEPHSSKGGLEEKIESWISRFSETKESGYFYPVNEVTLNLDMGNEANRSVVYRLSTGPLDSDELLQVKEELEAIALPYDLENHGDTKLITVDSTDQIQLQTLVTKLKTYQIPASLAPYTEEH